MSSNRLSKHHQKTSPFSCYFNNNYRFPHIRRGEPHFSTPLSSQKKLVGRLVSHLVGRLHMTYDFDSSGRSSKFHPNPIYGDGWAGLGWGEDEIFFFKLLHFFYQDVKTSFWRQEKGFLGTKSVIFCQKPSEFA